MSGAVIAHSSPIEHATLVLVGVGAVSLYGWGWFRSTRASTWRLFAWCGGIAALVLSVLPAVERWAQESFTGHMAQHLAMIVLAAPLIVIARPVRTIQTLPIWTFRVTPTERAIARRWRAHGAIASAATFVFVLYITHLTSIYDAALSSRIIHDLEHLAYVASAVALWAAVRAAGRDAVAERIGAVFGVIAGSALLGVVLLSARSPLVSTYAERLGTTDALSDQRTAASLMWVGGMATTLPLLVVAVWSWATSEERIAHESEALRAIERR